MSREDIVLKKDNYIFDIFNNAFNNDSKNNYNYLIYFFVKFVMQLRNGSLTKKEIKTYKEIIKKNEDALVMYLYLCLDILRDQQVDENYLNLEDLSPVTLLKGNIDITTLDGKKIVLNQIRNAFAHKSGKITFFKENDIRMVKIDNKGWFSIKTSVVELNRLLKKLFFRKNSNDMQKEIENTIISIRRGEFENISLDSSIIILLNLLMCYNKESVFDKFMLTQTSFINASKFEINSTTECDFSEAKLRQRFFDKFNINFCSSRDKNSYVNEWKSIVDIDKNTLVPGINYEYNIDNMPIDVNTYKHIPIPIFLNYLRNANCHGRIKIVGDNFRFYDKENGSDKSPYIYMTVNRKDLLDFVFSDYFIESIMTSTSEHENIYDTNLYLLEKAESANDFSHYINIYMSRMVDLSSDEVIKYMYDNNKFSVYLMENPNQIGEFLNYRLRDGRKLIDILASYDKRSSKEFFDYNVSDKEFKKCYVTGAQYYNEFLSDAIEVLKNRKQYKQHYIFFDLCYMFLHNLNSIEPNLDITNDIIINGSKELQKEFDYNDIALENSIFSDKLLVEIAIQQSNKSEMDRIIFALGLDNKLKKYTSEQKEKRHTIKDIHKHGTLARVYEKSSKLNLSTDNNQRKIVAKVLAVNLGVRLFNSAYILYMVKHGLASPEMMLAVSGFSILLCNLAIFKSWSNLRDILLKRSRHDFMIKKYSYKEELESNDEDRNNGSNNHRGR